MQHLGLQAELVVEDCTLQRCGDLMQRSAVLVGSGRARVTGCSITQNRGDGIVVQDEDDSAHLELHDCKVFANAQIGIAMYGGSANMSNNRVQENACKALQVGTGIHRAVCLAEFRSVVLTRNVFEGHVALVAANSSKASVLKRLRCDNNNSDHPCLPLLLRGSPSLISPKCPKCCLNPQAAGSL